MDEKTIRFIKSFKHKERNCSNFLLRKLRKFDIIKKIKILLFLLSFYLIVILLQSINIYFISNILFIINTIILVSLLGLWSFIDKYDQVRFKKLCLLLNKSELEVKILIKKYNL
jgi:uncharacterized protein YacL